MVAVYWSPTAREFLVQAMWRKPQGGSTSQGDPVRISEGSFKDEIAEAVLKALADYDNPYDPARVLHQTGPERDDFRRRHIAVVVEQEGDRIKLFPMERRGRGYAGTGSKITLRVRDADSELPTLLRRSFSEVLDA